jgi:hypothetical protein
MRRNASPARLLLTLLLLAGLFFGAAGGAMARVEENSNPASIPPQTEEPAQVEEAVNPAPRQAVDELNVFISEFRTRGAGGANDEFIEIFNATGKTIQIGNWKINKSSSCGTATETLVTILPADTELLPGQYYLIGNSTGYSGSTLLNQSYTSSKAIADDGGIALVDTAGNIIDQAGMCAGTLYKEGMTLSSLGDNVEQSYERKSPASIYSCIDTDNNAGNFQRNSGFSNPQNFASAPTPCLVVTNVTSSVDDTNPFSIGASIPIQVIFSNNVNVTGAPTLLIETGATDRTATYASGSGTDTLTFTYTVQTNDTSSDLDYVSSTSLSLNGGSITGAIGNAILILPKPGPTEPGSLSFNKNIKIDTTNVNPTLVSITRLTPAASPTNADTLVFRATFSEAVINVDESNFDAVGLTGETIVFSEVNGSVYDFTVSGGGLDTLDGTVSLKLIVPTDITDIGGLPLNATVAPNPNHSYVVDNTAPTVTITQKGTQADPAGASPIVFDVTFDEEITSFTSSDITQVGTAAFVTWSIATTSNPQVFTLSAYPGGNGTVIPAIPQDRIADIAGNGNSPYSPTVTNCSTDNRCVTLQDITPPAPTIEWAATQTSPTTTLPIRFTIDFKEPINVSTFTVSDITQTGTATGVTWNIANSGDDQVFTLSAISSGYGTVKPYIAANRVLDLVGLNNTASTSTDGEVTYVEPLTVTINQAADQKDPTLELPITFTVNFSRKINPDTFTDEDITQTGTAAGVTWRIIKTKDEKVFTLRATSADSYGTLIPVIFADRVTDFEGLFQNTTSTSTDGSVNYIQEGAPKTVVISEVGWMGTAASSSDEWIELYNTTNEVIHLDGWELRSLRYNGEDFYINLKIQLKGDISPRTSTDPGDMSGYFLLETRENAISNIPADQLYTGSLYNSGEILLLCSPYNLQPGSPAPCNINVKNKLVDFVNGSLTTSGNIKPWPAGSSSTYGSMERKNWRSDEETNYYTHTGDSPRFGFDANGNAIKGTPRHPNWADTVTATPRATYTPTRTPTPRPAAAPILVINEVLARAGTDWNNDGRVDIYDEFIEVMNAGTVNVSLSGYKLDDEKDLGSAPFSLPSQTLKPGEKAVFYGSQTGIRLEDSGDTVRLLKASNSSVVDAVTYTMVKSLDFSVCRYTDGYGSWILGCFPTPGRPNQLTGERFPSTSGGQPIPVCVLPDSVPEEFVLAECEEGGLGIWNPFYWDASPGEGNEIWQPDERDKWLVIYQ